MSTYIEPEKKEEPEGAEKLYESFGKRFLSFVVACINKRNKGVSLRYDRDLNRLSIHGKSENPGDVGNRRLILGWMTGISVLFSFGGMLTLLLLIQTSVILDGFLVGSLSLLALPLMLVLFMSMIGSFTATARCEIFDHTTEKQEDSELEDLVERYLSDELSEDQLEAELESELT